MPKREPSGYIAQCPVCGTTTAGIDATRLERRHVAKTILGWAMDGRVVVPKFGAFCESVRGCSCKEGKANV